MNIQFHEANRSPYYLNEKRPSLWHIIVKFSKIKENPNSIQRKNNIETYKGSPIRLSADFSARPYRLGESGMTQSEYWKQKLLPRIFYPVRLSFRYKGEIQTFPDNQKRREFITTRPALQNAERNYSSGNEKMLTSDMKTCESIQYSGKGSCMFRLRKL